MSSTISFSRRFLLASSLAATTPVFAVLFLALLLKPTISLSAPLALASMLPQPQDAIESSDATLMAYLEPSSPTNYVIAGGIDANPQTTINTSLTSNTKINTVTLRPGFSSIWIPIKLSENDTIALTPIANRTNATVIIRRRNQAGFEIASLAPLTQDLSVEWYVLNQSRN